ncbi:phosphomannomutase/phosphoglucomutase [Abditibacteriota bacterium]|nr:phosphomannomutase/phosphoglucomutase [Abditibacteriota bacterium]
MAGIFKAYDIRGLVGDFLTPHVAYLIGRALAARIFRAGDSLALTRDMRTHSPEMFAELSRGLRDGGVNTVEVGLAPTPMNYWAINRFNTAGGVQVTASHNGPAYNGFKVSGKNATPMDYDGTLRYVEEFVLDALKTGAPAPGATPGQAQQVEGALDEYLEWMNGFCAFGSKKLRVGIDAGNGMGGFFLSQFFEKHPQFELVPLYFELDGTFPNHEADPLKAENLHDTERLVIERNLDLGVAFDGDADRCMFVDENGDSVSSDLLTALIAGEVLKVTPGSPILYDLRSSQAVPQWIEEHGGKPVRGRVGHTFMKRLLKETGARFGGELSGHYYFADCYKTDSGLMALIQILNLLSSSEEPMSQHIAPLRRYSATGEINYRVTDAAATLKKLEEHYEAQGARLDHLDGLTVELGDITTGGWWFNLRSSNTEPLLRLNLEALTPTQRDEHLKEVQGLLGAEPVTGH